MKALVGAFNQEKALVGAFSVIVKTGCGTDGTLHSTIPQLRQTQTRTEGWVMTGSGAGGGGGGGGDFPIYINLPSIFLSPRDNPSLFKLVDNFVNFHLLRFK